MILGSEGLQVLPAQLPEKQVVKVLSVHLLPL